MVVDTVIYSHLNSTVSALGGRIYPQAVKNEVKTPYLVFNKLADSQERLMSGEYESIARAEFELLLWSSDYISGKTLSQTLVNAFRTAPKNINGIAIELIQIEEQDSDRDNDTELILSALSLVIFYQKAPA